MNKDCLSHFIWRSDYHTQQHMNITLYMLQFVEDSILMLKANRKKDKKARIVRFKQLKSRVGDCVLNFLAWFCFLSSVLQYSRVIVNMLLMSWPLQEIDRHSPWLSYVINLTDIKHLLHDYKGDMKIYSPSENHISRGQRRREIWFFCGK